MPEVKTVTPQAMSAKAGEMGGIGSFVIVGISNLLVKDKSTKELKADISTLIDIKIDDQMAVNYLRGGEGNNRLLSLYGDRDSTLTANNATNSTQLMAIMANTQSEKVTEAIAQKPYRAEIVGGAVTLPKSPKNGMTLEVFKLDAYNKKTQLMSKVSASPTNGQYTINGGVITFASNEAGKVEVYYYADASVEKIAPKSIVPKTWLMEGVCLIQEIETGITYTSVIKIPNGSIQPNFSFGGSNSADVPDSIALNVDLLAVNGEAPYEILIDQAI